MSRHMSEVLLLLAFSICIASTVPVSELTTSSLQSSGQVNAPDESWSLLEKTNDADTMNIRKEHIDEEPTKSQTDVVDDSKSEIVNTDLKYEVEILQPGKVSKENIEIEERFRGPSLNFDTNEFVDENIEVFAQPMPQGHVMLTIALVAMALVSIGIYVGMVMWRTNLEKRYGMRQRLMTEDDFCANIDDTRPF